MHRAILLAALGLGAVAVAAVVVGPAMSRVEQPDFRIEKQDGDVEVRAYGPLIAAEAEVKGQRREAINEGFRLIAAYIFGANQPKAKIEMTAPVEQQKQKIAMTAPVTQQGGGARDGDESWTVRFIMPKAWTMETLPTPTDSRVRLEPIPPRRFLAIRFSGFAGDDAIREKTDELRRYAETHGLAIKGEPVLAFYDPPWTLPFMRRNEVMFELADGAAG
ncbi:heme-binding protein [Rhodomicrobium udaipurense JA643]|uniref:Heme-binding protein n=1 Tax=Rhodomicrobium udaipurense TaxID=1202716 RepID=A0A8I1GFP8_9HYPH|nr:heme-binding protein [Rhodomicrobium udaipurense]KAI96120.1 heme-binding protein [Rhodomicrobium udaipurense JA643]MBJ7544204.1 heme-binding protein [Rhodomicrobium udaipurense]